MTLNLKISKKTWLIALYVGVAVAAMYAVYRIARKWFGPTEGLNPKTGRPYKLEYAEQYAFQAAAIELAADNGGRPLTPEEYEEVLNLVKMIADLGYLYERDGNNVVVKKN